MTSQFYARNMPVTFSPGQILPRAVIGVGDSIMFGSGAITRTFIASYGVNAVLRCHVVNLGVGGYKISDVRALDGAVLNLVNLALRSNRKAIVVTHVGTNDLGAGRTPATVLQDLYEYTDMLRANGALVVVGTILPRQDAGEATYGINASRAIINTNLRSQVGVRFNSLADYDTNDNIGLNTAPNSTTWYDAAKVHPTQVGHDAMEVILRPQIDSL